MGILRTREEYLPVTCAILKAEDRESFFGAVKQKNGRPEQIARLCEVPVETANDWISGKANIPYHSLQNLAHHFEVPLPPVGELRREYLEVHQTAVRREAPPRAPRRERREEPTAEGAKEPRRERGRKRQAAEPRKQAKRQGEPKAKGKRRQEPKAQPAKDEQRQPQPQQRPPRRPGRQEPKKGGQPKGPRVPGPSEQLAYWVGVTILAAKREGSELVMTADRRTGQNFAGTWASLTRELCGVRPTLRTLDEGKAQEARLPVAGFEEFLDRLEIKEGKAPGEAGVPRWAWSNPAWKAACLKGIVDARAYFQRQPALVLEGIPERLGKAVQKMLAAFKLEAVIAENGTITLKGVEALDQYFEKVGCSNMKLRDQYRAFRHPRGGRPPEGVEPGGTPEGAPEAEAAPGAEQAEEEHGRVMAEEVEAADEEAELTDEHLEHAAGREPQAAQGLDPDAAADAAAAAKAFASAQPSRFAPPPPQPKKPERPGRRRTLFRGRPRR